MRNPTLSRNSLMVRPKRERTKVRIVGVRNLVSSSIVSRINFYYRSDNYTIDM